MEWECSSTLGRGCNTVLNFRWRTISYRGRGSRLAGNKTRRATLVVGCGISSGRCRPVDFDGFSRIALVRRCRITLGKWVRDVAVRRHFI